MSIAMPLYAQVIDGIVAALEEVAAAEAAEDPALNFEVSKNRGRPYIESQTKKALVNVLLNKVDPDTDRSSVLHGTMEKATYHLDMYVRGTDNDLTPADEAAVIRLQLLAGQVRHAITAMKNARFNLAVGKIEPRIESSLQFYELEDDRQASSIYAPARYMFSCYFPYTPADISPPALETIDIEIINLWRTQFNYEEA